MTHYYDSVRNRSDRHVGRVYHYDSSGNNEIIDFESEEFETPEAAEDRACEWAEENGIDASLA